MPCYDPQSETADRETRDITTRLACMYCRALENNNKPIPFFAKE